MATSENYEFRSRWLHPKNQFNFNEHHKELIAFSYLRNSSGKRKHKIVLLMVVLPRSFHHHRLIRQCMTHSLLKLETVNTPYVSAWVFQLFPRYHPLHRGSRAVLLHGHFPAIPSSTSRSATPALREERRSKVGTQKGRGEKTKHSRVFLRNTFLALACKTRFSGSGSYRKPVTSQLLINTTQLQQQRERISCYHFLLTILTQGLPISTAKL